MHILFIHKNFPAQFGHVASFLVREHGFRCTFLSELPPGTVGGVERIQYRVRGGATQQTHFCSRTFENVVWHSQAIFNTLKGRPDIQPDLIVAHSGFATSVYLRELYSCPVISYFEYFYHTTGSDMDFRPDFPCNELARLRARTRNAALLLDLNHCNAGYSPTHWQHGLLPPEYQGKVRVIFDGIDTSVWKRDKDLPRRIGQRTIPEGTRIVTYVSRGMESLRGFDVFMKVAKQLCDQRSDVLFAVVGEDRICYSGDERFLAGKTFKQWVLEQDDYDLSRILFLGRVPARELAALLAVSDLHIYLTAPFILSWSMMNALSCGAVVLASDTPPVREMIEPRENGLLLDFFDVDGFVQAARDVLNDPGHFRQLGENGAQMIRDRYSLDACLPKLLSLYEDVANR